MCFFSLVLHVDINSSVCYIVVIKKFFLSPLLLQAAKRECAYLRACPSHQVSCSLIFQFLFCYAHMVPCCD